MPREPLELFSVVLDDSRLAGPSKDSNGVFFTAVFVGPTSLKTRFLEDSLSDECSLACGHARLLSAFTRYPPRQSLTGRCL
jgi:hypothetical protein